MSVNLSYSFETESPLGSPYGSPQLENPLFRMLAAIRDSGSIGRAAERLVRQMPAGLARRLLRALLPDDLSRALAGVFGVDAADDAVRVGTAHDCGIDLTRKLQIVGIAAEAAHERGVFAPGDRLADPELGQSQSGLVRAGVHVRLSTMQGNCLHIETCSDGARSSGECLGCVIRLGC